jgi:predicted Kef-type K+ transport protein
MEAQLLSIQYSDPLWIAFAFVCGFVARAVGLPPMVGFLAAGFLLNVSGVQGGEFMQAMADLGITLLLFTIGLKLRLQSLAKPEVWGVATLHMGLITLLTMLILLAFSYTSLPLLSGLTIQMALLIAFALSFSSTVFAVKILDELGASSARHGQTAIGVLVMQDIAAVVFIAASMGKLPSLWALGLLPALIPLRWLIFKLLDRVGHGELLILFGITAALVGADLSEMVGMKGDVGALVFGMLIANHAKAKELARALLGLKELFLVGFFLSIGMTALPGLTEVLIAMLLIFLLPMKVALYFGLFNLFRLRASTSWRTSLNLANYSEFGLIVGAVAVSAEWLPLEWLAVFAVVMSISLVVTAPLIIVRDSLYRAWRPTLKKFERSERLPGEENLDLEHIKALVFGMGRIGTAAYDAMASDYHEQLVGVEIEEEKTIKHNVSGRYVVCGDGTNPDFWTRAPKVLDSLEWVLLTLPMHKANMEAAMQFKEMGYQGRIAATAKFPDEEDELRDVGVDHTFNIYTEAGLGFAGELQGFISK